MDSLATTGIATAVPNVIGPIIGTSARRSRGPPRNNAIIRNAIMLPLDDHTHGIVGAGLSRPLFPSLAFILLIAVILPNIYKLSREIKYADKHGKRSDHPADC